MRGMDEDASDVEAVRTFNERLARGEEELIPAEFVNRMIDGENKVKVWREYRGLLARDLAEKAGISIEELNKIENGSMSPDNAARIAAALGLTVDDL